MRSALIVLSALALAAASAASEACDGPDVSPQDCESICGADRVCLYSDDRAGHGLCVCEDNDGNCPAVGEGGAQ